MSTKTTLLQDAVKHWPHVEPLVRRPRNKRQYDELAAHLDALLEMARGREDHPLSGLINLIADQIEAYDQAQYPIPEAPAHEVLVYLLREHGLKQRDLAELGSQGVVSEILSGKRKLNARQIALLAQRFGISADAFLG